jgi:RNA polymerase-interacting CarD/CdnL/TRCF family regulator
MERSTELRIKGHLYEIRELNDEVIESRQGLPSSLKGYQKTLESVARSGTVDELDTVADVIKKSMREQESRPKNKSVREAARDILADEEILPEDYLLKV